jgi:hypothetical protein
MYVRDDVKAFNTWLSKASVTLNPTITLTTANDTRSIMNVRERKGTSATLLSMHILLFSHIK